MVRGQEASFERPTGGPLWCSRGAASRQPPACCPCWALRAALWQTHPLLRYRTAGYMFGQYKRLTGLSEGVLTGKG